MEKLNIKARRSISDSEVKKKIKLISDKEVKTEYDDEYEFSSSIAKAKLSYLIKKVMRIGKDIKIYSDGKNLVTLTLRKPSNSNLERLKMLDFKNNWADVVTAVHAAGAVYFFRVIPSVEDGTEIKSVYLVKGDYRNRFIEEGKEMKLMKTNEMLLQIINDIDELMEKRNNLSQEEFNSAMNEYKMREKKAEIERLKFFN